MSYIIIKPRIKPIRITVNEALLRRLPANHYKREVIKGDLLKRKAGFRGEQSLDYYFSFLSDEDFYFLHDLRLPYRHHFFQIDTLILTSYFLLIIEVKNISGTLLFDRTFNQLIRTKGDKTEGFADPISQVSRHQYQLGQWMKSMQLTPLPIESIVVMSNPAGIIKTENKVAELQVQKKVIHAEQLMHFITNLRNVHNKEILSRKLIKKLNKMLLKSHTPPNIDIHSSYQIPISDIKTGVQCSECLFTPLQKARFGWPCPHCKTILKDGHIQAVEDYFLLISPTINNRQCRDFLHLSSDDTAYRILTSMNLSHNGKTKGRVYTNSPK
jgi:hypothetical protein